MTAEPTTAELTDSMKRMLLIRRAEEQVIHFADDFDGLIRGHYHVYIGQESSGVGACNALRGDDFVWTTHRNHGHVIARGGEPGPVLAEIIGRVDGYNKGRGGTFHVTGNTTDLRVIAQHPAVCLFRTLTKQRV